MDFDFIQLVSPGHVKIGFQQIAWSAVALECRINALSAGFSSNYILSTYLPLLEAALDMAEGRL